MSALRIKEETSVKSVNLNYYKYCYKEILIKIEYVEELEIYPSYECFITNDHQEFSYCNNPTKRYLKILFLGVDLLSGGKHV